MMQRPSLLPFVTFLAAFAATAPAQDQAQAAPAPDLAAKKALLEQSLAATAALDSLTFESKTKVENQMNVAMAGRVKEPRTTVSGKWAGGLLQASFEDGADEVVMAGRRTIVRPQDGAWALRRGKLSDGRTIPHVLDPETFFAALARTKLSVVHAEVGALDDQPVEIVTVHVTGDDANALCWAGVVPEPGVSSSTTVFMAVGGAGGVVGPKTEAEMDLAFWIDPAQKRILQVKSKTYSKSAGMAGGMVVFRAGAGGVVAAQDEDEEEEEEATAKKKDAAPTFKDGLPVRKKPKKENWSTTSYDVRFKEHGSAKPVALDAKAKELLNVK